MSDPLEDLLIKQNWSEKFTEALDNYTVWANILNRTVRDGIHMFGKETCDIMCADLKNKYTQKLKEINKSRGTNGRRLEDVV